MIKKNEGRIVGIVLSIIGALWGIHAMFNVFVNTVFQQEVQYISVLIGVVLLCSGFIVIVLSEILKTLQSIGKKTNFSSTDEESNFIVLALSKILKTLQNMEKQ